MPTLDLSDQECSELMNRLIATDPLLMKIGEQLRQQQQPTPPEAFKRDGNSKEARHE